MNTAGSSPNHAAGVASLRRLIDAWCDRRAYKPLSILLPAWLAINGLTDGWKILRSALRHTRAMCHDDLPPDELDTINSAIAEIDTGLAR